MKDFYETQSYVICQKQIRKLAGTLGLYVDQQARTYITRHAVFKEEVSLIGKPAHSRELELDDV